MKRPSSQRLARVLLLSAGVVLLFFAWLAHVFPRGTGERLELSPGVVGVQAGGAYAWILRSAHGAVLIDTGLDREGQAVLAELKRMGLGVGDVKSILLTHGHRDHWAAAMLFPEAQVYVGERDIDLLRGRRQGTMLSRILEKTTKPLPAPAKIVPVKDGQVLELDGLSIRVIALPGHTEGSMAYLAGDTLFVGDSLFGRGDDVVPPPSFLSESPEENLSSLRKLIAAQGPAFTRTADGHVGITQDARQKLQRLLR